MNIDLNQIETLEDFLAALTKETGLTMGHLAVMEPQMPLRFRDASEILLKRPARSHAQDLVRLEQLVQAGILEHGKRRPEAFRLTSDGRMLLELFWHVRMMDSMAGTFKSLGVDSIEFA